MDLSGYEKFVSAHRAADASIAERIEADLELQKAQREADLMGPALGGSLSLLCAAWFAGVFWPMLVVAALRLIPDYAAQTVARALVARIDAGRDYRPLRDRAHLIALFTGAGWGLVTWPIREVGLSSVGAVLVVISVYVTGIMVTFMTVPSPGTLKRWIVGWLTTITMPLLVAPSASAALFTVCSLSFAGIMLWLSRRLHGQLRELITLQHANAELNREIGAVNEALAKSLVLAEHNARHDALTGLANRRSFEETIVRLHPSCDATGRHLLLIDVDRFKTINDRFGHASGDIVLASLSEVLAGEMRQGECCARWGGEEFVALLLDCSVDEAVSRADVLRRRIGAMRSPDCPAGLFPVTASIGIAPWGADEPLEAAVARADEAMYRAKNNGRNQAHYAGDLSGPGLSSAA